MFKKIIIALLVVFGIAQFFNPEKNESDIVPASDFILTEKPSEELATIFKQACYDCHSNHTNYPWYDRVTPVNYWVEGHVKHGKGHLNLSLWSTYSPKKKAHKLEECIEMLEEKEMPLKSYTLMHGEAKLSDEQIKKLNMWLTVVKLKYEVTEQPL